MRNWTPEERAKQAEKCRQQKPWLNSTGPKTAAGMAAAKMNAYKHGFSGQELREIKLLLDLHELRIKTIIVEAKLKRIHAAGERTDKET